MLFVITIIGFVLIYSKMLSLRDKSFLLYGGGSCLLFGFLLLPFFDPFQIEGFLASVLLDRSFPNLIAVIIGIIVINCGIYGVAIFLSSMVLKHVEKQGGNFLHTEQYQQRRHPIHASYQVMFIAYSVLMGSITCVILTIPLIIYCIKETRLIEKRELIPRYGQAYQGYMKNVQKRMYSVDIFLVLLLEFGLFFLTLALII